MTTSRLSECYGGFRERPLAYQEVATQLRAWARAFPSFARVEAIGTSREGRELLLLTIGRAPERGGPAAWIDGNIHASELAGSSVALSVAEDALALHAGATEMHGLGEAALDTLRGVTLHVLPRMSPDGAEAVLETGRWVRSVPRDERTARSAPYWVAEDIDGDGLALLMRREDPTGDFVESREVRGVMLPRRIDDAGPYFRLYPEGTIHGWDGESIPTPDYLSDNSPDLNRNFPWSWAPEHEQPGAGAFATSEPESRAVVEFADRHPSIFAWLNLHTFGGVLIRPSGHHPDTKMDPSDLALFKQLEAWADEFVGYPTVSGYEQFTYEPDKPLRGDLSDYAYEQRGALAWVCELWDLFEELGLPRKKRFVERYLQVDPEHVLALARWDAEKNAGRIVRPWKRVNHPQLGDVEVGGFDPRIGIWNPPHERLAEICRNQSAMFLRVAAMAPRVDLTLRAAALAPGTHRVDAEVRNLGYLPTYGLASARRLSWNEPLHAEIATEGCALADPRGVRQCVGHLDGWGRGRHGQLGALHMPRTTGAAATGRVSWIVAGSGEVRVRVSGPRVGSLDASVRVG